MSRTLTWQVSQSEEMRPVTGIDTSPWFNSRQWQITQEKLKWLRDPIELLGYTHTHTHTHTPPGTTCILLIHVLSEFFPLSELFPHLPCAREYLAFSFQWAHRNQQKSVPGEVLMSRETWERGLRLEGTDESASLMAASPPGRFPTPAEDLPKGRVVWKIQAFSVLLFSSIPSLCQTLPDLAV